jgi:hypothetical protein
VSEVLCLARAPEVVKRLAAEKEEIFLSLTEDHKMTPLPGVMQLLETLRKHDVRACLPSYCCVRRLAFLPMMHLRAGRVTCDVDAICSNALRTS